MDETAQLRDEPPTQMLREYLHDDAATREQFAVRFVLTIAAIAAPILLAMGPVTGWRLASSLALVTSLIFVYATIVHEALSRGWYHPVVPWLNSLVEVSLPLPFLLVETLLRSRWFRRFKCCGAGLWFFPPAGGSALMHRQRGDCFGGIHGVLSHRAPAGWGGGRDS